MTYDKIKVLCVDTGTVKPAEVLERKSKSIKVVFVGTETTLTLYKQTPTDKLFKTAFAGMEFTTTGDLIDE